MRSDKRKRAMAQYTGHNGAATVAHVERNLLDAYPQAVEELTGRQYGLVMSVANKSYHDGGANATANGEVWDYVSPTNWVAGIGSRISDGRGGYRNRATVEVRGNTVTIVTADNEILTFVRQLD